MTRVASTPAPGGDSATTTAPDDIGQASQVADENQVHYDPGQHEFEVLLDGKMEKLSPLEAVCLVLQNRYIALSDETARKTQDMQDQVNQINEANKWLGAVKDGEDSGSLDSPGDPSESLQQWMDDNDIDVDALGDSPDSDDLKGAETKLSNYVDQLSSTNDLKMLSLKTTVNKSQEALTAADGVLQELKQLMQTITGNMAR